MDKEFSNLSTFGATNKPKSSPKKRAFIYVILFALIIGLAILVGNYFLSGKLISNAKPTPTPLPSPTVAPTPTSVASVSATPEPTGKVTPTPSSKVTPTNGTSKSLQVEVLNGSGTPGEAGKAASILKSAGYTITSTGNADTFDYQQTVIQIKKSKNALAAQLKKDLSTAYSVDPTVQTLAESSSADAIVIVGTK